MKRWWLYFVILSIVWGSSFLWIKIGVQELNPLMLVAYRLAFASLGCATLLFFIKQKLPRDRKSWLKIIFYSLINPAIPFILITWAEQRIASGTAALLNGSTPLFAYLGAHFMLGDERLNIRKVSALSLGFLGLILLYSRSLELSDTRSDLLGKLAVTLAAACYGFSLTWAKKHLGHLSSLCLSSTTIYTSTVMIWALFILYPEKFQIPQLVASWAAVAWLGILGTGLALFMFFALVKEWGATRASLVTYTFPLVGYILGYIFLREELGWSEAFGGLSVIGSVVILNRKLPLPKKPL